MRIVWLILLCIFAVGCSGQKAPSQPQFVGVEIGADDVAHDFALTDHLGRSRSMRDFRGKVVALFFGYTHCPDVCPTTMSDLAKSLKLLGDRRANVQVLFVTLDPARDTQQVLAQYVPSFDPTFIGLRGDAAALERVEQGYKVFARKQPSAGKSGYTIDHSTGVYVFDPQGMLRLYLNYGQKPADIAHDIGALLQISNKTDLSH
jgi:protein SCO1/2